MTHKTEEQLRQQYQRLLPALDERGRREWAGSEAMTFGRGGIMAVHRATGMARNTIRRGIRELQAAELDQADDRDPARAGEPRRLRRPGGGRKKKTERMPELAGALEALIEPTTRGDPQSALRWTLKSARALAEQLLKQGFEVSSRTVHRLLKQLGYSLQANKKMIEGTQDPDRDAQFRYIAQQTAGRLKDGLVPVLSVDTKKKELVGAYKNGGREYHKVGDPERVKTHDFIGPAGRVSPYGVYDVGDDSAWVSVGVSADTSEFAVHSVRRWWEELGAERYEECEQILITADGGGSNSHRTRLWKFELQKLADELGRMITVCHYPTGTSKWNRIEHRLFCFITMNWRGKPLIDYRTVVELIGATKTDAGLEVHCALDENLYEKARKVSDEQMDSINLFRHDFRGDWNYTIVPHGA